MFCVFGTFRICSFHVIFSTGGECYGNTISSTKNMLPMTRYVEDVQFRIFTAMCRAVPYRTGVNKWLMQS